MTARPETVVPDHTSRYALTPFRAIGTTPVG